MKKKVLVQCELPTDYCLDTVFYTNELPAVHSGDFYLLTKEKKLVKKTLLENGFAFEDVEFNTSVTFYIQQVCDTDMGMVSSIYRITVKDGTVTDISEIKDSI